MADDLLPPPIASRIRRFHAPAPPQNASAGHGATVTTFQIVGAIAPVAVVAPALAQAQPTGSARVDRPPAYGAGFEREWPAMSVDHKRKGSTLPTASVDTPEGGVGCKDAWASGRECPPSAASDCARGASVHWNGEWWEGTCPPRSSVEAATSPSRLLRRITRPRHLQQVGTPPARGDDHGARSAKSNLFEPSFSAAPVTPASRLARPRRR
jgi:hypothetical protein